MDYRAFYTGGWGATAAFGRATAPASADPTNPASWTKDPANPLLGQGHGGVAGAVAGNNLFEVDGFLHLFFYDSGIPTTSPLYHSKSTDGGRTWSLPTIALAANAVPWATGWANCTVWRVGPTDFRMVAEAAHTAAHPQWTLALVASPDMDAWTVQGAGPLTSLQRGTDGTGAYGGPDATVLPDGSVSLLYHAALHNEVPTDIYRAIGVAPFTTWTPVPISPSLTHRGLAPDVDQVADPAYFTANGKGYLFYSGVNNATSSSSVVVSTYVAQQALAFIGEPGGDHW